MWDILCIGITGFINIIIYASNIVFYDDDFK